MQHHWYGSFNNPFEAILAIYLSIACVFSLYVYPWYSIAIDDFRKRHLFYVCLGWPYYTGKFLFNYVVIPGARFIKQEW